MEIDEGDLAALWWRFHGSDGPLRTGGPIGAQESNQITAADDWVLEMSQSVRALARLLELLVRHAPSDVELPYIGTWVLEEADMNHAASPQEALAVAKLSPSVIEAIESGYQPWPRDRWL